MVLIQLSKHILYFHLREVLINSVYEILKLQKIQLILIGWIQDFEQLVDIQIGFSDLFLDFLDHFLGLPL